MKNGRIVILSGPSGSGKTTLHQKLLASPAFKAKLAELRGEEVQVAILGGQTEGEAVESGSEEESKATKESKDSKEEAKPAEEEKAA